MHVITGFIFSGRGGNSIWWSLDLHLGPTVGCNAYSKQVQDAVRCSLLAVLHLSLQQICPNSVKIAGSLNIVCDERRVA